MIAVVMFVSASKVRECCCELRTRTQARLADCQTDSSSESLAWRVTGQFASLVATTQTFAVLNIGLGQASDACLKAFEWLDNQFAG